MNILLLGSSGQLGTYLLNDLQQIGNVTAPTRAELDVADIQGVIKYFKKKSFDWVINTTAYNLVNQAEVSWEDAYRINAIAVRELAAQSYKIKARFITYSTDYVYDGTTTVPYAENATPHPLQVYGASKLSGENLAQAENPFTYIIRTAGLYGSHGSSVKGNFVLNRLQDAKTASSICVSGDQTTSTTYAADLSMATVKLMKATCLPGIYHLVNAGAVSWAEFTKEIYRLNKSSVKVCEVNNNLWNAITKRPKYSVLKNTAGEKQGIILPHWKDALARYTDELSKNQIK